MKTHFMALLLFAALFLGKTTNNTAYAETPTTLIDVDSVINKLDKHITLISSLKSNGLRAGSGSAVCIEKNAKETKFLTAKHIVSEDVLILVIKINGEPKATSSWSQVRDTDAIVVTFSETLPFEPIELNLDDTTSNVPAIVAGYYGVSGTLTATIGHINRSVSRGIVLKVYNYQVIKGLIAGTPLVFPGYSGGGCFDVNGKLLGITVLGSALRSSYVDIRYIMSMLGHGNKVPYSDIYPVYMVSNYSRIPLRITDKVLINAGKEILFSDFISVVRAGYQNKKAPSFHEWIQSNTIILVGEEKYKVAAIELESRGNFLNSRTSFANMYNTKYLYFCEDGWFCIIHLANS